MNTSSMPVRAGSNLEFASVQAPQPQIAVPAKSHADMDKAGRQLRLLQRMIRAIFRLVFKVRVEGLDSLPKGPAILCANHLGWTDAFLALLFLPVEPRIYVLGEQEVRAISAPRRWAIDKLGVMLRLDRRKPVEAIRTMQDVLEGGGSLLIFPEGKVGTEEGMLGTLQSGAAHLSLTTGIPLVPLGFTGPSVLWLRRKLFVRVGTPLDPLAFAAQDTSLRSRTQAMTSALRASMLALLPGDTNRPYLRLFTRKLTSLF